MAGDERIYLQGVSGNSTSAEYSNVPDNTLMMFLFSQATSEPSRDCTGQYSTVVLSNQPTSRNVSRQHLRLCYSLLRLPGHFLPGHFLFSTSLSDISVFLIMQLTIAHCSYISGYSPYVILGIG